eukprot:CAMPEP_0181316010 /NCGR_PEP_ID=MMETSP1101-20121128/15670_1 /TAXON_ID=46948 /ORGANISM="Rhodomonas abbreviata, Strain Caron Lab Isolate" /LENGTH=152 /DNA_ID=CAMNT_0023423235 /DNA_START=202 /DNA_END=660 /DNA_ORIENTATION=-
MAHLDEIETVLVSPTPIRPVSPAGSPSIGRDVVPEERISSRHLETDEECCDYEGEMELGLEIFEIFQSSLPSASVYSNANLQQTVGMRPPSRNQNPLVKDQVFYGSTSPVDRDSIASNALLCSSFCGDMMRSSFYDRGSHFGRPHAVMVGSS